MPAALPSASTNTLGSLEYTPTRSSRGAAAMLALAVVTATHTMPLSHAAQRRTSQFTPGFTPAPLVMENP